jgi:DNA primase
MYQEGAVYQVLSNLGVEVDERGDELLGLCPMHLERTGSEDHSPSWSMNSETGVHHCFSCGYKGNLITLVAELNDFITEWGRLDLEEAKNWLRGNIVVDLEAMTKQLQESREMYIPLPVPVAMSEARLAVFTSEIPQWALDARGLKQEACDLYGVRWNPLKNSWIAPIRETSRFALMGWQEKSQTERFFRNRPTGVAKSKTLFGIDTFTGGTMIVVESPLDAVKLQSLGVVGGVSTFGAAVSDSQLQLMKRADKLIFALDNDAAGKTASTDVLKRLRKFGMECWFANYDGFDYKDIGDMPEADVYLFLEGVKHSIFGEVGIK